MSTKKPEGEAFARLRAADPAADLSVDHTSLRDAVTARSAVADELAVRRRRPSRALQVAAASAGALAIGASGFALGGGFASSIVADGAETTSGARPAMTLDAGGAQPEMATEGGAMEPAVGGRVMGGRGGGMAGDAAYSSYLPGYGSRTVFTQSGLSTSGTSAVAYGYDAESVFGEEALRRIADALGVEGEVREEYGSLMIGSYESGAAYVSIYGDGTASFNYYDSAKDTWFCSETGDGECTERDLGDAVQGDEAIDEARDVLVRLGLDPASFELEASDGDMYDSKDYSSVTASRVVDGQRSGDQWVVSFTGAGVQSVWGSLADVVELGTYDVVSPAEAVERLGDPRFGASNSVYPLDWIGPAMARDTRAEGTVPTTPKPGTSFDWAVENVTIVSDTLGLAQHHLDDGSVVLVPTYELGAADGRTWSVIAVADSHLNF